jgi:hypothetical protein
MCSVLLLVKDSTGLPNTGVYKIQSQYGDGDVYVRVKDHTVEDHIK